MIQFILDFYNAHSSVLLWYAYALPVIVNTIVFTERVVYWYRIDLEECENIFYHPKLTIGMIVGYLLGIVLPIINCVVFVFNTLPALFKIIINAFSWLEDVLDIPLVPPRSNKNNTP